MFISFGELNRKWIFLILIPILITLRWYFESKFEEKNKNLFFNGFLRFLARILNFIPWLFLKKSLSFREREKKDNSIKKRSSSNCSLEDISFSEQNKDFSKRNYSQFEIESEKKKIK